MTQPPAGEEEEKQDPKIALSQKIFLCTHAKTERQKVQLRQEILSEISDSNLAPVYQHVCTQLELPVDQGLAAKLKAANDEKVAGFDAAIKDAEENLGETDVRDAVLQKADYYANCGYRAEAEQWYKEAEGKAAGSGLKMDMVFSRIRVAILYSDWGAMKALIARGHALIEEGGDWERRNRLQVYEALYRMATRDFKRAADLFLDSIATFTTHELFDYRMCVFYAVVTAMVALDRVELKTRVVNSPEVLQVMDAIPHLRTFLHSLYHCHYADFFPAFVGIVDRIAADQYLAAHVRYYMREMRLVAYAQFLDPYKSVTLASMAAAFRVGEAFLDRELSDFIVRGRISAKMDKVAGVIETKRPDNKNYLYQQVVKQGNQLLNRVQKLSKVIDIE